MKCKKAKVEIALLAGHDLDDEAEQTLLRHFAECPHCRDHWRRMEASLCILQEKCMPPEEGPSLWPGLVSRLSDCEARPGERFNGWMPATAVVVACLVLVALSFQGRPPDRWPGEPLMRATPVGDEGPFLSPEPMPNPLWGDRWQAPPFDSSQPGDPNQRRTPSSQLTRTLLHEF